MAPIVLAAIISSIAQLGSSALKGGSGGVIGGGQVPSTMGRQTPFTVGSPFPQQPKYEAGSLLGGTNPYGQAGQDTHLLQLLQMLSGGR